MLQDLVYAWDDMPAWANWLVIAIAAAGIAALYFWGLPAWGLGSMQPLLLVAVGIGTLVAVARIVINRVTGNY